MFRLDGLDTMTKVRKGAGSGMMAVKVNEPLVIWGKGEHCTRACLT